LLAVTALTARAGQIPGHIYTAMQSRSGLTGPAKTAVDNNLAYYLTGAQGPDTIGIIQYELRKISFFNSVGEETHYSPLKALLAFNVLAVAKTDQERAYALGWMTHYVNDSYVHPMVNNYGGFYEKHKIHHKELEQLETKHVFMRHSDVVIKELATTIPTAFGKEFPGFIFDAYHETYPNEKKYQSGNDWGIYPNREYFADQEDKAAKWCLSAEQTFYNSHIDGTGKHGYWPSTIPIPNMPSNDAYAHAMKAIEITDIATHGDHLTVTVKVNDSKLYGRFIADWEKATTQAIADGRTLLAAASAYVANPNADTRLALLRLIPNANLDQPRANFDDAAVFPGDITVDRVKYKLTVTPQATAGKAAKPARVLQGTSSPIIYGAADFCNSSAGTATIEIPLGADLAPYKFELQAGLSGTVVETRPEYRDVDWTEAQGTQLADSRSGPGWKLVSVTVDPEKMSGDNVLGTKSLKITRKKVTVQVKNSTLEMNFSEIPEFIGEKDKVIMEVSTSYSGNDDNVYMNISFNTSVFDVDATDGWLSVGCISDNSFKKNNARGTFTLTSNWNAMSDEARIFPQVFFGTVNIGPVVFEAKYVRVR